MGTCGSHDSRKRLSSTQSFQLPQSPEADELDFARWRQVADFPAEADFPANGCAIVNDESPEAAELDGIAIVTVQRSR